MSNHGRFVSKRALVLAVSLVAACAMASPAFAEGTLTTSGTDTVQFAGQVVDDTCQVSINGDTATADSAVNSENISLPAVSSQSISTPGKAAVATPFTISVTGCPSSITSFKTLWTGQDVDSDGNLGSGTAPASGTTNAAIEINIGPSGDTIDMSTPGAASGVTDVTDGAGTETLYAEYVNDGASGDTVNAGTVDASATFVIQYN